MAAGEGRLRRRGTARGSSVAAAGGGAAAAAPIVQTPHHLLSTGRSTRRSSTSNCNGMANHRTHTRPSSNESLGSYNLDYSAGRSGRSRHRVQTTIRPTNNTTKRQKGRVSRSNHTATTLPTNDNDIDEVESDSDDEEEVIEMPPLVPRGYDSDDSESEDEDNLPTIARHKLSTKKSNTIDPPTAARHKSSTESNPTKRPGFSLQSIGLKVAGFDEKRQQKVCERTNNERFSASFGVSAKTLEAVFIDMKKKDPTLSERDFLMAVDTLNI